MKAVLLPNGDLQLTMPREDRAWIKRNYPKADLGSDKVLWEVMEGFLDEGPYERINPADICALTEAPMLCIRDGSREVISAWAFMDYQVRSLLEELLSKGEAILTSGNDGPVVDIYCLDATCLNAAIPVSCGQLSGRDIKAVTVRLLKAKPMLVGLAGIGRTRGNLLNGCLQIPLEAMDALCATWQRFRAMQAE